MLSTVRFLSQDATSYPHKMTSTGSSCKTPPDSQTPLEQFKQATEMTEADLESLKLFFQKNSGLPLRLLPKLHAVAKENDCIIAFRPVERSARFYLEKMINREDPDFGTASFDFSTKGIDIKGKLADWGPQFGLVCIDQKYSKLSETDKIKDYNEEMQKCIDKGYVTSETLTLYRHELQYALDEDFIQEMGREQDGYIELMAKNKKGEEILFKAHKLDNNEKNDSKVLWEIYDNDGEAIKVAGKPREAGKSENSGKHEFERRYITGDLDPFFVGVPIHAFGEKHNPSYQPEDNSLGYLTEFEEKIFSAVNAAVTESGKRLVQHGPDSANPFPDMTANFPLTLVLPKPLNDEFKEITIIHGKNELARFVQVAKDSGFHIPLNPGWDDVSQIKRSSFKIALALARSNSFPRLALHLSLPKNESYRNLPRNQPNDMPRQRRVIPDRRNRQTL